MRVNQFTVRYIAEEDRLLLRLNTLDRRELRFYLTRRFVRLLWPVLERILKEDQERRHPIQADAAEALMSFEREKALSRTDFGKKFDETPAEYPLGEAPVLLSRIRVVRKQGVEFLSLLPGSGPGIELPAHPGLLHSLRRLVQDATDRAQWDLNLSTNRESSPNSGSIH